MLNISVLECVCKCVSAVDQRVCVSAVDQRVCVCLQWINRARQHCVTSMIDRPRGPMRRD